MKKWRISYGQSIAFLNPYSRNHCLSWFTQDKHKDWLASTLNKHMQEIHAHATSVMPIILISQRLVFFQLPNIHALKVYKIPSTFARAGLLTWRLFTMRWMQYINGSKRTSCITLGLHFDLDTYFEKKINLVLPQTSKYNKLSSCSKTWFWPTTERRSLRKCLRKRVCHWCEGIVVSRSLPYKN